MERILKVENVSIGYKIGDFRDTGLKEWIIRRLTHNYHVEVFQAVQDVSFELNKGEMLGIVGSNGAGKSTLLKAVSGIMSPTSGTIRRNGNVAALLELSSGFDGDLTVKENAYLRGAMLGYTERFMDEKIDEIIGYAELRAFTDRPFKQLSTGMQSRLAFAIASLVDPDLLILDEVLSVGDGAFQEKSAKKMLEIIAGGAATILVSHSLETIRNLCTKVLWLDHGRQVACGTDVRSICDAYDHFLKTGTIEFEADGHGKEARQQEQENLPEKSC
ncbi:MAG: ABC transporter ATP-binding protein [Oscillospiraceae bacterium]|nr:ABC transporter ATP-binding protein [Oscillospiraceae bacterium]